MHANLTSLTAKAHPCVFRLANNGSCFYFLLHHRAESIRLVPGIIFKINLELKC